MPEQSENRPLTGKAVTYKGSGGYEVIQFLERAVRAPAADEVRIEVKAAAVNPTDLLLRARGFDNQGSPVVPGMDAAGIIERSDERRVGKECVSTCRSRWSTNH